MPDDFCTLCSKRFNRKVETPIEVLALGRERRFHAACWEEVSNHKPLGAMLEELKRMIEEHEHTEGITRQ